MAAWMDYCWRAVDIEHTREHIAPDGTAGILYGNIYGLRQTDIEGSGIEKERRWIPMGWSRRWCSIPPVSAPDAKEILPY